MTSEKNKVHVKVNADIRFFQRLNIYIFFNSGSWWPLVNTCITKNLNVTVAIAQRVQDWVDIR